MHRWSRLVALTLTLIGLITIGTRASAQDATPAVFPITPDPAECQRAPRPAEEAVAVMNSTPVAAASPAAEFPPSVESEAQLPQGAPADAATEAEIIATARELIACNNAGEYARVFAFYTDDLIRSAFGSGDPAQRAEVETILAATPAPLPAEAQTELLDVRGIRVLDDGRVGAVMEDRDPQQTNVVFLIFERAGDQWLVDGQISIQAAATPTAGTPTG